MKMMKMKILPQLSKTKTTMMKMKMTPPQLSKTKMMTKMKMTPPQLSKTKMMTKMTPTTSVEIMNQSQMKVKKLSSPMLKRTT